MEELEKLQAEAAKRFLQTVLIVDDRASMSLQETPEDMPASDEVVAPPGPNMGGSPALAPGPSSQAPPSEQEQAREEEEQEKRASEVDVKQLADRFADLGGLTCGMLKPTSSEDNDEVTERIIKAAHGVDIVVIDWMLDPPDFTAKEAIRGIVAAQRTGRRLIAIYTTQRDLEGIAKEVKEAIPDAAEVDSDELAIDAGGVRVLIYHKGGVQVENELESYICPEAELPKRLVSAFATQTAGLVPAVALSALAATRENTHRLLGRLHKGLDLGYLGHLLRLADRDEGRQHLVDAISGEFRAVIEDDEDTGRVATEGFSAWLTDHEDRLAAPIEGLKKLGASLEDKTKKAKWREEFIEYSDDKITTLLVGDGEKTGALDSDASFAQLMAMRRPYSHHDPALRLGAIVSEKEAPDNFWLCIQPVCDSVRLSRPTAFLMLPLDPVQSNARASFVVTVPNDADGTQVFLHLWNGSSDLELMRLAPNHKKMVVFQPDGQDGLKVVTTEEGTVLVWIAQLKPAHASRVAHEYGMNLSRVGLDESEWLRKRASQGSKPKRSPRTGLAGRISRGDPES